MGLLKGAGILAAVVGAGALLFAKKRSEQTGRDIAGIMSDLPAELKQAADEMRQRLKESIGIARQVAAEREAEIDEMIAAEERKLEEASRVAADPPASDVV